jgi:hypothetical protein
MTTAESQWLHTLGQAAGTLLMLELCFVLLLVCVIVGALAYASWWLHHNVIPLLDQYGARAQQYMGVAIRGSDRVVNGVAEFRGRWEGITTGARVMLFGTRGARRPTLPTGAEADGARATLAGEAADSGLIADAAEATGRRNVDQIRLSNLSDSNEQNGHTE